MYIHLDFINDQIKVLSPCSQQKYQCEQCKHPQTYIMVLYSFWEKKDQMRARLLWCHVSSWLSRSVSKSGVAGKEFTNTS